MTYFQLNGLLLDHFYDSEYFCRMSRLETINEYKPVVLLVGNLQDIEHKLRAL